MEIAQVLSNYTLGEADLLRRAMGKKIKKDMDAEKPRFISGALKNKIDNTLKKAKDPLRKKSLLLFLLSSFKVFHSHETKP